MSFRYRRGRNWVGAAILITVGVVGLVANFNLVPPQLLEQLWKMWPVIPLAIGVSILIGRQRYIDRAPSDDLKSG